MLCSRQSNWRMRILRQVKGRVIQTQVDALGGAQRKNTALPSSKARPIETIREVRVRRPYRITLGVVVR
jgi:hypothetical protein